MVTTRISEAVPITIPRAVKIKRTLTDGRVTVAACIAVERPPPVSRIKATQWIIPANVVIECLITGSRVLVADGVTM